MVCGHEARVDGRKGENTSMSTCLLHRDSSPPPTSGSGPSLCSSVAQIIKVENRACVGLTLATLPGVEVQPFYLSDMDVPDPLDPPAVWRRALKMKQSDASPAAGWEEAEGDGAEEGVGEPIFLLYATAQSIDALGEYMTGVDAAFPRSGKIGAIASTVSR